MYPARCGTLHAKDVYFGDPTRTTPHSEGGIAGRPNYIGTLSGFFTLDRARGYDHV